MDLLAVGSGGEGREATTHDVEEVYLFAFGSEDGDVKSLGCDGDIVGLGFVNTYCVVEVGLEGDVGVDGEGAFYLSVAVAPAAESKAGEGSGEESCFFAIVVDSPTVDGTHVGVVGGGGDGEGLRGKDGSVCGIGQHPDDTGAFGVSVTPIFEDVVGVGVGGDGYLLAGVIGA